MSTHIKVLGWLHLVFGAFGLCGALFLLAAMMLGGLATGSLAGFAALSGIALFIAIFIAIISLPGLIAGYGLLNRRPWARTLAIVLGVLHLINIPIGTVFGIYSLWVLLSTEGAAEFQPVGY
ncbi:MAG: hypothetical protein M3081_09680 [Gemmatimonadota bacterium]|nr:hypothetical protein [Gemmatimonadota bacterium]